MFFEELSYKIIYFPGKTISQKAKQKHRKKILFLILKNTSLQKSQSEKKKNK